MPITQARLLSLLEEHEHAVSVHASLLSRLHALCHSQQITSIDILRELVLAEIEATMSVPTVYAKIERRHFNSQGKRNDRVRKRAEARRRSLGIPQREASPYRATSVARDAETDYDRWARQANSDTNSDSANGDDI
jgi:hypothetical protein